MKNFCKSAVSILNCIGVSLRFDMKYHPDRNQGDEAAAEKFKEVNEAHETLSDEQKRAAYDYELEHPGMGGMGGMM